LGAKHLMSELKLRPTKQPHRAAPQNSDFFRGPLEQDTGDLLGDEIGFLATHFWCHGGIVRNGGAHTYYESLIAHAAHDFFGVLLPVVLNGAEDRCIADGAERGAFWRALREVGGKLFGDVGHVVDRDAQVANGGGLLSGIIADAGALIVYGDGQRHRTAEDAARGGFVDPGTFGVGGSG
jgi:hypothetical protein